jgi:hypothetical protein
MRATIPEPWLSFLHEVDSALGAHVEVHCLGGFVLTVVWQLPRATGDVDVIEIEPSGAHDELLSVGGDGSVLSAKYQLRFHRVTIAQYPDGYASRLMDITPAKFRRLRLLAFESHDLALAKLARNSPRDREDVAFLVEKGALQKQTLQARFEAELRDYVLNEERETRTLQLWLEEFFPRETA